VQIAVEEAEGVGQELLRAARFACRALDQAPTGFVIARFDGECLAVNATFAGWLKPPIAAEHAAGLSLLADAGRCPEFMVALRTAARGEPQVIESDRVPLLWNRLGHFRVHVLPFPVADQVLAATIMVEDITEQVLVTAALEASERRFRQIVECASDGIVVHRNNRVLYANPSALRLLGSASAEELVGTSVADLIREMDGKLVSTRFRPVQTALDDGLASVLVFRSSTPAVAERGACSTTSTTVLVCDDEERLATLTAALLEQQGYRTFIASGADSAASVAEAQHFDVLVLDVNLACSSASAVLQRVAKSGFEGPTILTSGYPEEDVPAELLRHPRVTGYVAKPYSVERLVEAIDHALERDRAACQPGN
jgi:CheY-like chemotaxis protein